MRALTERSPLSGAHRPEPAVQTCRRGRLWCFALAEHSASRCSGREKNAVGQPLALSFQKTQKIKAEMKFRFSWRVSFRLFRTLSKLLLLSDTFFRAACCTDAPFSKRLFYRFSAVKSENLQETPPGFCRRQPTRIGIRWWPRAAQAAKPQRHIYIYTHDTHTRTRARTHTDIQASIMRLVKPSLLHQGRCDADFSAIKAVSLSQAARSSTSSLI